MCSPRPSTGRLHRAGVALALAVLLSSAGCGTPPLVAYETLPAAAAGTTRSAPAIRVAPLRDEREPSRRSALGALVDGSGAETRRYGTSEVAELGSRLGAGTTEALQAAGISAWLSEGTASGSGPVLLGRVEEYWLRVAPAGVLSKRPEQVVRLAYELHADGQVLWTGRVEGHAHQQLPFVTAGTRSRVANHALDQALERAVSIFRSEPFREALAKLERPSP